MTHFCMRKMMAEDKKPDFNLYAYSLEIGFRISIPLVVFVIGGVWLDKQFHTGHTFLFSGIALSLVTSALGIKNTIDNLKGDK
jgi:hypothetical protein